MTVTRTGQTTEMRNQTRQGTTSVDFLHVADYNLDTSMKNDTRYSPDAKKWFGYYRRIPEYRLVINKLSSWTFGRGIKGDKKQLAKIEKIKGWGKDSGRGVLKNQWKTAMICGDSFAHIIKDKQGRITNLKPLNPGRMNIVANAQGIITRYELDSGEESMSFSPSDIYHLSFERLADEIHGIPFAEALENLLEARGEALEDLRILYHRQVKPIHWIEVETSNQTKLDSIETSVNNAYTYTENIIVPTGVIKEIKNQSTPQFKTLDTGSLNYIKFLVRQFVTSCGVPEVVMGWGEETTESASKVILLAFQQEIEDMQLYNEEMIKMQLNIEINLEFPASIETEGDLQQDQKKDGKLGASQPSDTKVNMRGKK